jgi:DNA-directed RNA polymerase subunit RPC12/RpoP
MAISLSRVSPSSQDLLFCLARLPHNFIIGRSAQFNQPPSYERLTMDVIFNCPKCEQELAVDSSGAGSEINCPACGEAIVIPSLDSPGARPSGDIALPALPPGRSSMQSSAAAKIEMHLKVPDHKTPVAALIEKPLAPLEVAAKESDKKMKVKTIKHTDCIEVGHDKFDEVISNFLMKVGEPNIVSLTPLTYTHLDIGSQKLMTDFGVMIVYRG